MRYSALEQLFNARLMDMAAHKMHLYITDARLARELQNDEFIASLRGSDGKLDIKRYEEVLARQGMSPQMFENSVRADLSARQVLAGITETALSTPAQAAPVINAYLEQHQVQLLTLPASDYAKRVPISAMFWIFKSIFPTEFLLCFRSVRLLCIFWQLIEDADTCPRIHAAPRMLQRGWLCRGAMSCRRCLILKIGQQRLVCILEQQYSFLEMRKERKSVSY